LKRLSILALPLSAVLAMPVQGQLGSAFVQLPTEPFVWPWGEASVDDRSRPDFEVRGREQQFDCELTGSFRLGSRMKDFYNLREFEHTLSTTLYFIQDTTYTLNDLYRMNELDWAILDCQIPTAEESVDEVQERIDRAVERAERQRERRRRREESDD
jgi:hypothetical protein